MRGVEYYSVEEDEGDEIADTNREKGLENLSLECDDRDEDFDDASDACFSW